MLNRDSEFVICSKLVEVVSVANVSDEDRVGNSLLDADFEVNA